MREEVHVEADEEEPEIQGQDQEGFVLGNMHSFHKTSRPEESMTGFSLLEPEESMKNRRSIAGLGPAGGDQL